MDEESRYRSAVKSILWRLMGIAILTIVTYAYTRSWIQTSLITFLHHTSFIIIFYLHERVWLKVKRPKTLKWRSIAKMLTYETVLGNLVLGLISFAVSGSWKQMTMITLTYIGIKHIVYIFNEFMWDSRWFNKRKTKEIMRN